MTSPNEPCTTPNHGQRNDDPTTNCLICFLWYAGSDGVHMFDDRFLFELQNWASAITRGNGPICGSEREEPWVVFASWLHGKAGQLREAGLFEAIERDIEGGDAHV